MKVGVKVIGEVVECLLCVGCLADVLAERVYCSTELE